MVISCVPCGFVWSIYPHSSGFIHWHWGNHVIVGWCGIITIVIVALCEIMPWASYQIGKIAGCACAGNAGNVSPRRRFQRKPLVSDPGMHHGTCVTHVLWCMSGSLTCGDGENVPSIPGACAPAILRIWQEVHCPSASEPSLKEIGEISQRLTITEHKNCA